MLAVQEIIDVYIHRLETPRRAIPELVLLCERFPNTPAAETARRELSEMRDILAREHEGLGSFTSQFLKKVDRGRLSAAAGLTREELERQMISEALQECGDDRRRAAEKLGVPLERLERTMHDLGML